MGCSAMRGVLLVSVFASSVLGAGAVRAQTLHDITFVVDKEKVRLSGRLTPANLTPDDRATVTAKGTLFKPPRVIVLTSPRTSDQSDPLATVANYYKASVSGTDEEVLAFWKRDERAKIEKMLEDPDLRRRNRQVLTAMQKMEIKGVLDFPHNRVVFLTYGASVLGFNTVDENGKWYLMNEAPHDLAIAIAEAAFSSGTVTEKGNQPPVRERASGTGVQC